MDKISFYEKSRKIEILFSVEVNATFENGDSYIAKYLTKENQENLNELIQECIEELNTWANLEVLTNFSIEEQDGCYISESGQIYNEDSYCLCIPDTTPIVGRKFAKLIMEKFQQEGVLILIGEKQFFVDKNFEVVVNEVKYNYQRMFKRGPFDELAERTGIETRHHIEYLSDGEEHLNSWGTTNIVFEDNGTSQEEFLKGIKKCVEEVNDGFVEEGIIGAYSVKKGFSCYQENGEIKFFKVRIMTLIGTSFYATKLLSLIIRYEFDFNSLILELGEKKTVVTKNFNPNVSSFLWGGEEHLHDIESDRF